MTTAEAPPAPLLADQPSPPHRLKRPPRIVTYAAPAPNGVTIARILQMVSIVLIALLLNVTVVSQVQHYAWQNALFGDLRLHLAQGSAPTGPALEDGQPVAVGTPLALFTSADIGIGREVVVEGTSSAQTMQGIGHLRSTVLPCQIGTSVLMARSGSYGAVGSAWARLRPGQTFQMTTSQGSCEYKILGSRLAGDPAPPLPVGRESRLILTTASGVPFLPDGVLRVDAEIVTDSFDRPPIALPDASLPASERAMGIDDSGAFGLVLLLQALAAAAIGLTWLWRRWGRWEAWIVGIPVIAALGLLAATNANYFLPNLL